MVFAANVVVIAREHRGPLAEDAEIDVDEQLLIGGGGRRVVPRCDDQRENAFDAFVGDARCGQTVRGPLGAAQFVIVTPCVVDRIVKPQGELDLVGMRGERAMAVELLQARTDVASVVVVPVRP